MVVNAMKKWIEEHYDDFTETMRRALHDWIAHMAITRSKRPQSKSRKVMNRRIGVTEG